MPDQSPMPRWLRTLLAAMTGRSAPHQQAETEQETDNKQEEQNTKDDADDIPNNGNTAKPSPKDNATLVATKGFIIAAYRHIKDKLTFHATQARDAFASAIEKVKQLGVTGTAKAVHEWAKQNPWKAAVVVVPIVAIACTAIALLFTGFGPGGIIAGSAAAGIQAGIGSVVAHSVFATCTSAMMGGYGALTVFGGVWLGSTALVVGLATAWKRWKSQSQRALVRAGSGPLQTTAGHAFRQAASDARFATIFAAAYVVYRFRRWYRGL